MKELVVGQNTFEIVESISKGYSIWNIGKNMIDGYLPLCEPISEGSYYVNTKTLKAIKIEGAQTILEAIGGGQNTTKKMEKYINRYSNSKKISTLNRVERMRKALEVMNTLKWD